MELWTEIRRKVLVEGASKRSIRRDYGLSGRTLDKILANPEPPGYRQRSLARSPSSVRSFRVIDEILEPTRPPRQSSATPPGGSSSASETNTATRGAPRR